MKVIAISNELIIRDVATAHAQIYATLDQQTACRPSPQAEDKRPMTTPQEIARLKIALDDVKPAVIRRVTCRSRSRADKRGRDRRFFSGVR